MDLRVLEKPVLMSWLCYLLAVYKWAKYFMFLGPVFSFVKREVLRTQKTLVLILSLFSMTPICLANIHMTKTKNIISKVEESHSFSILNLHRPVINFDFSSYQKY